MSRTSYTLPKPDHFREAAYLPRIVGARGTVVKANELPAKTSLNVSVQTLRSRVLGRAAGRASFNEEFTCLILG